MSSALQAGEESETDSEEEQEEVVPRVQSDAIQAGEESETDDEEDGGNGSGRAGM